MSQGFTNYGPLDNYLGNFLGINKGLTIKDN
jgi:hypothetical protein